MHLKRLCDGLNLPHNRRIIYNFFRDVGVLVMNTSSTITTRGFNEKKIVVFRWCGITALNTRKKLNFWLPCVMYILVL